MESCLEDLLPKYADEVRSMSKACFGLEQLFSEWDEFANCHVAS